MIRDQSKAKDRNSPNIDPNTVRQSKQSILDALEQRLGTPLREITPRRPDIREENGVPAKGRVGPDHDGRASGRVPGREHDLALELAQLPFFSIFPEVIKLGSVALHVRRRDPEDIAKGLLNHRDPLADASQGFRFAVGALVAGFSELLLEIGGRGEMVGVNVSLDEPLDFEPAFGDVGEQSIGRARGDLARDGVVVEDGVDNDCRLKSKSFQGIE